MNAIAAATALATKRTGCCSIPVAITVVALSTQVAGVVMAILASQIWTALCIALSGAITGYLGIKANSSATTVTKMTLQMQQDAGRMEEAIRQAGILNQNLAQQRAAFEQNLNVKERQLQQFRQENGQLAQAQRNWAVERQQFELNNRNLDQKEKALTGEVNRLNQSHEQLKIQLQVFQQANAELARNVKAFSQAEKGLEKTERDLEKTVIDLDKMFDEDTENLERGVQTGKIALQDMIQFMKGHQIEKKREIEELKLAVADLRKGETIWKKEIEETEKQRQQIEKDRKSVEDLQILLREEREKMELTQRQVQEELEKINEDRKNIDAQLTQTEHNVLETEKSLKEAIQSADKQIETKRQILEKLDEKIKKKMGQLGSPSPEKKKT